jgi:hypothetical protein
MKTRVPDIRSTRSSATSGPARTTGDGLHTFGGGWDVLGVSGRKLKRSTAPGAGTATALAAGTSGRHDDARSIRLRGVALPLPGPTLLRHEYDGQRVSVRDTPVRPHAYRRGAAPAWAYGRGIE